jgi:hypothetical protein
MLKALSGCGRRADLGHAMRLNLELRISLAVFHHRMRRIHCIRRVRRAHSTYHTCYVVVPRLTEACGKVILGAR